MRGELTEHHPELLNAVLADPAVAEVFAVIEEAFGVRILRGRNRVDLSPDPDNHDLGFRYVDIRARFNEPTGMAYLVVLGLLALFFRSGNFRVPDFDYVEVFDLEEFITRKAQAEMLAPAEAARLRAVAEALIGKARDLREQARQATEGVARIRRFWEAYGRRLPEAEAAEVEETRRLDALGAELEELEARIQVVDREIRGLLLKDQALEHRESRLRETRADLAAPATRRPPGGRTWKSSSPGPGPPGKTCTGCLRRCRTWTST